MFRPPCFKNCPLKQNGLILFDSFFLMSERELCIPVEMGQLSSVFLIKITMFHCRRLSDAGAVDSECSGAVCTNSSPSDEGSPAAATPASTEQPMTAQGEKHTLL